MSPKANESFLTTKPFVLNQSNSLVYVYCVLWQIDGFYKKALKFNLISPRSSLVELHVRLGKSQVSTQLVNYQSVVKKQTEIFLLVTKHEKYQRYLLTQKSKKKWLCVQSRKNGGYHTFFIRRASKEPPSLFNSPLSITYLSSASHKNTKCSPFLPSQSSQNQLMVVVSFNIITIKRCQQHTSSATQQQLQCLLLRTEMSLSKAIKLRPLFKSSHKPHLPTHFQKMESNKRNEDYYLLIPITDGVVVGQICSLQSFKVRHFCEIFQITKNRPFSLAL